MIVFTARMKKVAPLIRSVVTFRLLHTLPDHLNFVDFVQIRTVELAAELGTDSGNISRGMKELHDLGVVEREGRGPRTAWRLSSDYGWIGNVEQFHAFRNGRLKGKKPPARSVESRIMHIMETHACVPAASASHATAPGVLVQAASNISA